MKKLLPLCFLLSINFTISHAQVISDTIGAGSALSFDNNPSNYVDLGTSFKTLNFPFSVEAWLYPTSYSSINAAVFSTDNDVNYCGFQSFVNPNGQVYFIFGNDLAANPSGRMGYYTSNSIPLNTWSHIAMVCSSPTDVAIYINGVSQTLSPDGGSATITNLVHNSNTSAAVGLESTSNGQDYYGGQIDEVRLWGEAISQTMVQTNMCKKISPSTTGLLDYWRADEPDTSNTVYDYTSNQVNGTIEGTVSRVISNAPLGNSSSYLYSANFSGQSVRCGAVNGDTLIASEITGTPNGVQVYAVNSSPYYTQGLQLVPNIYFGVFCVGGAAPTYTPTYHYKLPDGFVNIINQDSAALSIRTDATDTPWTLLGGTLNTLQQTVVASNQNSPNEYILSLKGNYTPCGLLNIVNNPDFEIHKACPTEENQLNYCDGWSNCNGYYGGQTCGSPDYLNTCGTGRVKLPNSFYATVYPHSGAAVADYTTYDAGINYREYIETFFTTPMLIGQTYTVSYYLTTGTNQNYDYHTNNEGVLFSTDSLHYCYTAITWYKPQYNDTNVFDTSGWKLFTFQFTADSAYKYITFGDFYLDSQSKIVKANNTGNPYSQIYVDDISVSISSNVNTSVSPSSDTLCAGTSLTLKATGGTSYAWSTSATTDSIIVNPTKDTIYTVNVSSGNCVGTDTAKITVNPTPIVSITPSSPQICFGQSTSLSASGAAQYKWSPSTGLSSTSGSSVIANPNLTTTYTIIGTNSSGCTDTTNVVIKVNPRPNLSITPASPQICDGQSVKLAGSGAATYIWSPTNGLSSTTSSTVSANPTITTTYTLYGTSSAGCMDSTKTTIVVNPLPVLTVSPSPAKICFRQTSAQLTVSGASSYTWSPSRGLSATTGSSVIANPTLTTTYTITGTNANQCTSTTTVVVIVDPLPVVSVTPSSPQICYGQSVALTASGAVNYQWSPSTALSSTTGVSIIANPTSTTTYTLLGTTSSGCSDSTAFTLKVNPLPVMSVTAAAPQICIGQSVKIKSSGASTYIWSPSTGLSATTGSLVTANPTVTTTYTVTGTSSFGCIDSTTTTIIVNPLPIITITPPDTALCHGYSATLKARGASTYQWIPARGLSSNSDSIVVATPSINTTYRVNGTSSFGCIDSTNIAIRVVQDSLKVSTNNTSICQGNSVVLTASGAYSYNWSPSTGLSATTGDTVTANPTLTTSYTLIATGAIGCLDTQKIVVTVNLPPVLTITPSSPQICIGHPTALKVSGAATYTWIPSVGLTATTGSSVTANPTVTTTYTSYGIDKHGCNDSSKVVVKVNPLPIVTVAPLDSLVCNGLSVPLTATGASAYKWSPAAGLNSTTDSDVVAAPLATTTYTVYGTDILGCTDTVTTVVRIIANSLKISVYPTNSIICLGNSAFITATGAKSYTWSPAIGINTTTGDTLTANPVSTTTYTVIGTGLGDCADTTVAVIIVSPPPVITVQPDSPVICYGQAIPLTASGASTYLWSPSTGLYETTGSQVDAHSSVTTLYTVYGRDSLKCIDSTKLTLIVKSSPVSSFTTSVPSICNPLQIQFSNISTAAVSYLWNFGDGDSSTEQNPVHLFPKTSIYTITLISTSENGCMDTLITTDTLSNAHSNLFVANSFTPSIPGMNQIFKPDIICTAPSNYTFKIYNRWGEMVFETNDPKQGWDGTYKGKLQPLGSYVYFLQVNCGVCNFFKKGDVTLIR